MFKRLFSSACSGRGNCSLTWSIEIIIFVFTITRQIRQDRVNEHLLAIQMRYRQQNFNKTDVNINTSIKHEMQAVSNH